jgi:hydroxyethylthiazole kinase
MSDEPDDVLDITSICKGLNINIGTLNKRSIEAMFISGRKAKELGHIVLLDPVGAGASKLRTETALKIMNEIKPDIIRGNISEIKTLALGSGTTKGVDADDADTVTEGNLDSMVEFAKEFSSKTGAIIAITGAIDLVADSETCYVIRNGIPEMSKITGTGCQLSGIATAYAVANPDKKTKAIAASVCVMGLAGEIGYANLKPGEGNSTLRNLIIDAIYNMDAETLNKGAKYEVR